MTMCPLCITTAALATVGVTSAGGAAALVVRKRRIDTQRDASSGRAAMNLPEIVSRDEWLAARKQLLDEEKALSRQRDAVNAQRRRLPMVKVDKPYVFEGRDGKGSLLNLFDARHQLIVYHFMFDPSWEEGCASCSLLVDNIGHLAHLHARDTTLALVSRAPLARIESFRKRMGWTLPWYSSFGSDFNYDFHVTSDE